MIEITSGEGLLEFIFATMGILFIAGMLIGAVLQVFYIVLLIVNPNKAKIFYDNLTMYSHTMSNSDMSKSIIPDNYNCVHFGED